MTRTICFDLEGPLSPQDNAYDVMSLVENGDRIFEVISKYDDMLALENREGYEPGDTLALIVPFLLLHNISEEDITRVSKQAKIVDGAKYLVSKLKSDGWGVYIISTSYEQHAYNIGAQLGVPKENIVCTRLPLSALRDEMKGDFSIIERAEKNILELYEHIEAPEKIVHRLDKFFFEELPRTGYGNVLDRVRVIGGAKKVAAVHKIVEASNGGLSDVVVVGDSITDYKMLKDVKENGGVAVVFNGNEYAIPYASIGLASLDIRFLYLLTRLSRKDLMFEMAKSWEVKRPEFENDPGLISENLITPEFRRFLLESRVEVPYFNYLDDADEKKMSEVINIHKRFRALVRGAVAKLG